MYHLSVPISVTNPRFEEYYEDFVSRLHAAGVERVFLCVSMCIADEAQKEREIALLRRYVPKLTAEGFEVGVWFSPIGHGGTCEDVSVGRQSGRMTLMKSLSEQESGGSYCPLDENYRALAGDWVRRLAKTGVRIVLLDDDFRVSFRGNGYDCCCERHRALLEKELGEPLDTARMEKSLTEGGPNAWRSAWLKVQGDVLRAFAASLRAALDEVDPTVRMAHCAVPSTYDIDGVSSLELAHIFAGQTRPLLRLIGAPYWASLRAFDSIRLGTVCEYERLQQAWGKDSGIELFCEGDVYPRPRYTVPAAYLEGFDGVMRAAGTSEGILKYMFDYTSSPAYETGYYDRHLRDGALFEALQKAFAGKSAVGVRVFQPMNTLAVSHDPGPLEARCIPASLRFAADNSLPLRYDAGPEPCLLFGDAAELAGPEELAHGAVLDAAAARILTRRGFDVGVKTVGEPFVPTEERYETEKETVSMAGGHWRTLGLREAAVVQSRLAAPDDAGEGPRVPAAFTYENEAGQRFLIYAFEAQTSFEQGAEHGVFRGWCRAAQLRRLLPWLAGRPLAAVCDPAPDLYLLTQADGESLTAALWNFGVDTVFAPRVRLGEDWAALSPVWGEASLCGREVTTAEIPAFGCVCFTLHR